MTLADFLLARIADDEAVAGAADALSQVADRITTSPCQEFADHITRFDPRRVFAECEAKRSLIYETGQMLSFTADALLKPFALVYSDHPDYRDEWRP